MERSDSSVSWYALAPMHGGGTLNRRLAAVAVALLVVAPACNSRLLRPPATIFVDGGESTVTANVGQNQLRFPAVLVSFIPSNVPLHPGDQVRFEMRYNGEPHTVALGKLVDEAATAIAALGPQATAIEAENLPEMQRLPDVFPRAVGEDGPRVNRSAAERCFLDSDAPPSSPTGGAEPCPEREPPDFDGTQTFYSSGFIAEGEGFRFRLAQSIAPGSYHFMCLVHRASMRGVLEVLEPSLERPTVAELKIAGRDEQRVVAAAVTTAARDQATPPAGVVLAGAGPIGEVRGFASAFVPEVLETRVGEPVTWNFYEMHTVSFRPPRRARDGILLQERTGEVKVNLDAWNPVGSPRPPPQAQAYPPLPDVITVDGGSWPGEGSWSSGVIRAVPPGKVSYVLRFSKPGTYAYSCLVHDQMRGRIVVS